jgi:hypothetical protein
MRPRVIQGFFPGGTIQAASALRRARTASPAAPPRVAQLASGGQAFEVPMDLLRPGIPGRPLPEAVQRRMERVLRADLSGVRVHVGPQAAALGAFAFTHGSDIYFAPGQYAPETAAGSRLLAHELTHVVQQRSGRVRHPFGNGVAVVQDSALEAEAERNAVQVSLQREMRPGTGVPRALQRAASPSAQRAVPPVRPVRAPQPRIAPVPFPPGRIVQLKRDFLKVPVPLPPIPLPKERKGKEPFDYEAELRTRKAKYERLYGLWSFGSEFVLPQLSDINGSFEPKLFRRAQGYELELRDLLKKVKLWLRENKAVGHGLDGVPDVPLELVQLVTETVVGIMGELNGSFRDPEIRKSYRELEKWTAIDYSASASISIAVDPILGVPPSARAKIGEGRKYATVEDYQQVKSLKQTTRNHVPLNVVKSTLKSTHGGAENVELVLKLADGDKQVFKRDKCVSTYSDLFSTPFSAHDHEIDVSKGDGEVRVLSMAYAKCEEDLKTHRDSKAVRVHQIGLVGPYGPCDGCKERIKKFKAEWLKLAASANCSASLVVTYFYRHGAEPFRSGSTLYGNLDAQQGEEASLPQLSSTPKGSYWYRSSEASYTAKDVKK